ncbi:hypothetical protein B0H19DRAFT_1285751 [Mycena capillaripes]|nr:hypothetical protein B0H19DRAFT_1285751 [Mycena capillaripes]
MHSLLPSIKQIWKGTRHKDISRSIRFFLWMLIHDGYKVGRHWSKISGSEHFGICNKCNVEESMNHILTECEENGQQQIWNLASHLWLQKTKQPLKPLIGEIMACGVTKKGTKPGTTDKATSRLYRILVSESAHLIWRLRNERRLQGKDTASEREIYQRWKNALNIRLALDCHMTDKKRYKKSNTKATRAQNLERSDTTRRHAPRRLDRGAPGFSGCRVRSEEGLAFAAPSPSSAAPHDVSSALDMSA